MKRNVKIVNGSGKDRHHAWRQEKFLGEKVHMIKITLDLKLVSNWTDQATFDKIYHYV